VVNTWILTLTLLRVSFVSNGFELKFLKFVTYLTKQMVRYCLSTIRFRHALNFQWEHFLCTWPFCCLECMSYTLIIHGSIIIIKRLLHINSYRFKSLHLTVIYSIPRIRSKVAQCAPLVLYDDFFNWVWTTFNWWYNRNRKLKLNTSDKFGRSRPRPTLLKLEYFCRLSSPFDLRHSFIVLLLTWRF